MKKSDAINNYKIACDQLVELFAKKQGFSKWHWVADIVGGMGCFVEQYFFDMGDILHDMETNQKKYTISAWQNDEVRAHMKDENSPSLNYRSYCMGFRQKHLKISK